jgi:hypothetical protein
MEGGRSEDRLVTSGSNGKCRAGEEDILHRPIFPSGGRRGFGSMFAHNIWDVPLSEHMRFANDCAFTVEKVLNHVEEIARVPGIGTSTSSRSRDALLT